VLLHNDLAAFAHAAIAAGPSDLMVLKPGTARPGNRAVAAIGTGLGQAIVVPDARGRPVVAATEGGHSDFGPNSPRDVELYRFLAERLGGHVSAERVVSGKLGLRNLVDFAVAREGLVLPPRWRDALAAEDVGAPLFAASEAGEAFALELLRWFAALCGAEAGNLALKTLALGGVVLGGGVATRLFPLVGARELAAAFVAKGRFAGLLGEIPVSMLVDPLAGLRGAALAGWDAATLR
jgi:glucokinase